MCDSGGMEAWFIMRLRSAPHSYSKRGPAGSPCGWSRGAVQDSAPRPNWPARVGHNPEGIPIHSLSAAERAAVTFY